MTNIELEKMAEHIWDHMDSFMHEDGWPEAYIKWIADELRTVRDSFVQLPSEEEFVKWVNSWHPLGPKAQTPPVTVCYYWLRSQIKTVQVPEKKRKDCNEVQPISDEIDWMPQVIKLARTIAKGFEEGIDTVSGSGVARDLILYLKKMDIANEARILGGTK